MNFFYLFDQPVPPQQEKQIIPKQSTYEQSLQDLLEGKKGIYVDPQYTSIPEEPPIYDYDDELDCGMDDDDTTEAILDYLGVTNYDSMEKQLNEPEITSKKNKKYREKIINDAVFKRNQLKAAKDNVTKQLKL